MDKNARIQSFHKLDRLVKKRNLKYINIADELGLSKSLFSDWKSGKSMPKMDKMIKITTYFGVEPDYFLKK